MFLMTRGLPVLVEIGLLVYCFIDCLQTPPEACRNLSKGWWLLLIFVAPIVGGIAWLVAGRPEAASRRSSRTPWPSTRTAGFPEYERPGRYGAPRGPDDDPRFLAEISRVNREQEQTLQQWEADLRRREEELRRRDAGPADGDADQPTDDGSPR